MRQALGRRALRIAASLALGGMFAPARAPAAPEEWPVKPASLRFDATIAEDPKPAECGVLAILPDGGLLPRPAADAVVYDEAGKELRSECVWANPREGMAVVFQKPEAGRTVHIYVRPSARGRTAEVILAGPQLKPSLLLYVSVGNASIPGAVQMSREQPPGKGARMAPVPYIGQRENVLGADDDYQSWYSGWLNIEKTGRYFFCSISDEASELLIDGRSVSKLTQPKPRKETAQGQYGESVDLEKGMHRLDYFHMDKQGDSEAHVAWRPPGTPQSKLPVTVPAEIYGKSGRAELTAAWVRPGVPAALIAWRPMRYLWVGDQPLNLFSIEAKIGADAPKDTKVEWIPHKGLSLAQRSATWIVEGDAELPMTLQVSFQGTTTASTVPLYAGITTGQGSVNNEVDREQFRQGLLARCRAVPAPKRPCMDWSANVWTTLTQVVELYKGQDLLQEIFDRSRADILKLRTPERRALEDVFYENLRSTDKAKALTWLDKFEQEEMDTERRVHWQSARVRLLALDLNDPAKARAAASKLQNSAPGGTAQVRALIALGDVERLGGNAAEAAKYYGAAQDKYRQLQRGVGIVPVARGSNAPVRIAGDWRIEAVREGSNFVTLRSLVEQRNFLEARALLDEWELEFPMSKLSGDFPIAEARYYMAIRDYTLAARILSAYRKGVDMTSFLPEAMLMEIVCYREQGKGEAADALQKEFDKRFPTSGSSADAGGDRRERRRNRRE